MEIKELVYNGAIPIFDPSKLETPLEELLLQIGGALTEAAVLLKGADGQAYYPSVVSLQNEKLKELGPKTIDLLRDVNIKVKGLIYVHYDEYLSEEYGTVESNGRKTEGFICPINETYQEQFLKILEEVSQTEIDDIILLLTGYASALHCFCENCRVTFSMDRKMPVNFNFSLLQGDKELYNEWIEWRSENIKAFLSKITEKTKELGIKPIFAVELDPNFQFEEGLKPSLGIDIKNIANFFEHFIVMVNPWEVILPPVQSKRFKELVQGVRNVKQQTNRNISLMYWPPSGEELKTLLTINKEVKSKGLYVFLQYPGQFKNWRETRIITP